jgi:hypothetical protein
MQGSEFKTQDHQNKQTRKQYEEKLMVSDVRMTFEIQYTITKKKAVSMYLEWYYLGFLKNHFKNNISLKKCL